MPPFNRGPMPTRLVRGEYYNPNDERLKRKGNVVASNFEFNVDEQEEAEKYASISNDIKPNIIAYDILICVFLWLIATALEFFRIKFSFLPTFLELDFSVFPEYIALVFYGPIVSLVIVLLKNITHLLIFAFLNGTISYAGELSNLIKDIVFIAIAFIFYAFIIRKFFLEGSIRNSRLKRLAISGVLSSAATSVVMLPVMYYVIYPMFTRFYEANGYTVDFLQMYMQKIPTIANMWQGLVIFNLPSEFIKLLCVTIISTIVYSIFTIGK